MKTIGVRRFELADRNAWEELARGYKQFYDTPTSDADYDLTWDRIIQQQDIHGFCADLDGRVVGLVHYLFHTTVWQPRVCYLQDLFTDPGARGIGVGNNLIKAVADHAVATECDRLYWNTQEGNDAARGLYDKMARYNGFIRYDYPLKAC